MDLLSFLSIILLLPCLSICQSQSSSFYYDSCAPSTCGNVTIAFPFSSSETFCGLPGYEITCLPSSSPKLLLSGKSYQVNSIYRKEYFVVVSDTGLIESLGAGDCDSVQDHFLPSSNFAPLQFPDWGGPNSNLSFLMCPPRGMLPSAFVGRMLNYSDCKGNNSLYFYRNIGYYTNESAAPCTPLALPIQRTNLLRSDITTSGKLLSVLGDGFPLQIPLKWQHNLSTCWDNCEPAGGRCGYNQSTEEIVCFCKDDCGKTGQSNRVSWKVIVATVIPSISIAIMITALLVKFRMRVLLIFKNLCTRRISQGDTVDVQGFIKNYRYTLPTEYSYTEIKKMTNGFKDKLGAGGYGKVFKGKLPNDLLIAIKILEKSRDNGQDFINEVATIGTIHHVNIIRLLGFCCDGSHRAIIYEFMPNGSLGDILAKEEFRQCLRGAKSLQIAVEIARGIEYLHVGCDKRILHLDIKPHNILLDDNFTPKISDFGLAKSYSRKNSIVSLTGARGTIGFIAPEVFMRNLGGVSHKSDVYSYGMLLLDMVIRRKKIGPETENSSKAYFPSWIYDQLYQWRDMELSSSIVEEELCVSRKIVMVALWCIQTDPIHRPSITEVLEMLSGRVESIEMPPKPVLFSSTPQQSEHEINPADNDEDALSNTYESSAKNSERIDTLS